MLINRLISSVALGAILIAAGAALPAFAHDRDDHRDQWTDQWRGDDYRDHEWRRWHHRHYRHYDYVYPGRTVVQERYYVEPRVYYPPAYVSPRRNDGLTIIYRDRW